MMPGMMWSKLVPSGATDFQSIDDLPGALRYVLKEENANI